MKAIGQRLREVRGHRTLAEFSELVGVGRTTWSNYEAGRRLPSHEVLELLRRIEDVPPDRILPSAPMTHLMEPRGSDDWWKMIPVLWLFSRLKGAQPFVDEHDELVWWAERLPTLSLECEVRVFEVSAKLDVGMEDAADEVCRAFSERSQSELLEFVDRT